MRILYSHRIQSRDGQGVHLEAMVASLRHLGHEVRLVGPSGFDKASLGEDSAWVGRIRRNLPGWASELAELGYAAPATLRLARAAAEFAPDFIYERANLFHLAGRVVAQRRRIPLLLEVNAPVEAMSPSDASYLRELLEVQLTRVNARLTALGSPAA